MKYLLLFLILYQGYSYGQKPVPRFENDTLYTTCGFKIYKGQTLQFAKGTGKNGSFRFVKLSIADNSGSARFSDKSIIVEKVKDFVVSSLGNCYITIKSKIFFDDGSKLPVTFDLVFDRAIESFPGLPSELIVPDEFKVTAPAKFSVADEIAKLYKLYQDGALTKEEYEAQKKKLLQ